MSMVHFDWILFIVQLHCCWLITEETQHWFELGEQCKILIMGSAFALESVFGSRYDCRNSKMSMTDFIRSRKSYSCKVWLLSDCDEPSI